MTPEERDRLTTVEANQKHMNDMLEVIGGDVTEIKAQANKWKGGFAVLLGVGTRYIPCGTIA